MAGGRKVTLYVTEEFYDRLCELPPEVNLSALFREAAAARLRAYGIGVPSRHQARR